MHHIPGRLQRQAPGSFSGSGISSAWSGTVRSVGAQWISPSRRSKSGIRSRCLRKRLRCASRMTCSSAKHWCPAARTTFNSCRIEPEGLAAEKRMFASRKMRIRRLNAVLCVEGIRPALSPLARTRPHGRGCKSLSSLRPKGATRAQLLRSDPPSSPRELPRQKAHHRSSMSSSQMNIAVSRSIWPDRFQGVTAAQRSGFCDGRLPKPSLLDFHPPA
jgi:hypothetical protein